MFKAKHKIALEDSNILKYRKDTSIRHFEQCNQ